MWASPLVPVKKAGGGIRLCVDYRKLNAITTKEPYYIPQFEEMVERVGQGCVLSKVDLSKGFHQVAVAVEDREKTMWISSQLCPAFVTIDVKAIAKSSNVLIGGSSFFKGAFLTKAMKSIMMAWVCGEVSGHFLSTSGHNFSSSVPSCDFKLFLK